MFLRVLVPAYPGVVLVQLFLLLLFISYKAFRGAGSALPARRTWLFPARAIEELSARADGMSQLGVRLSQQRDPVSVHLILSAHLLSGVSMWRH